MNVAAIAMPNRIYEPLISHLGADPIKMKLSNRSMKALPSTGCCAAARAEFSQMVSGQLSFRMISEMTIRIASR